MPNFAEQNVIKTINMLDLADSISRLASLKKMSEKQLGITRLGIFGSVARQENREDSDLDVVVEMEQPTLRRMFQLEESIRREFGCDVDLVQMRPTLRPLLRQRILKDVIYV
jgi:hypothetical protein